MFGIRIAIVTAASAGCLLLAAATPPPPEKSAAQKYFGCPTGYSFQVSGSNARCYLAGTVSTANIQCGFNFVYAIDQFNDDRDGCQNRQSNLVSNYTCPTGYSPNVRPGPDNCTKTNPPSIIAPTIEKSI